MLTKEGSSVIQKNVCAAFVRAVLLILVTVLLAGCGEGLPTIDLGDAAVVEISTNSADSEPVETLRIAVGAMISPEITREYYQDLMELIAARLGLRAVFSQRRTYAEVNELVENHEVDVAFICSGPYAGGHDNFGLELLAVPVVHGHKVYHSYILARRDSPIQSFDDLRGKRFAFTDPHSNTGCLVPTYMLARMGEAPESYFSETFFSGNHDGAIKAVADGLADGAAVDSLIWEFMNATDPTDTARTKIIAESPPYGIPPVVVHPDLDGGLKQQLKTLLLSIHEDPDAVPFLRRIQIDRFEEGDDSMYDTVRQMCQWVEQHSKEETP
jgi:phosphonate transport system substrate-binding protein